MYSKVSLEHCACESGLLACGTDSGYGYEHAASQMVEGVAMWYN